MQVPSQGRTRQSCVPVLGFIQKGPEDGEGGTVQEALTLGALGQVWTPTLTLVRGAAIGKSFNTSEPLFLFCKIKKIESNNQRCFRI